MTWYRELSQGQRLLLTAVTVGVTVTELSILTVLVNQYGRMSIERASDLWDGRLLEKADRPGRPVLPYSRQGILKALDKLESRGWIARGKSCGRGRYAAYWYEVRLLPLVMLQDAPPWLRGPDVGVDSFPSDLPPDELDPPATPVASSQPSPQPALPNSSDATPVPLRVTVRVGTSGSLPPKHRCEADDRLGPVAYYLKSEYSQPAAARSYAAKVFSRLLDRDVVESDLRPNHEGKGVYSYTLRPAKKGGKS